MSETRIILSKSAVNFDGYLEFDSVSGLSDASMIDVVIYSSSKDTPEQVMDALKNIRVGKFFYIASEDSVDPKMKAYCLGIEGTFIPDDVYLLEKELLDELLNSPPPGKELVSSGSFDVLADFGRKFKSGKTEFPEKYLELVVKSATSIMSENRAKTAEIEEASRAAVSIFNNIASDLDGAKTRNRELIEKAKNLSELIENERPATKGTGRAFIFPQIPISVKKNLIIIKEIGDVPFLTSFVMGLQNYITKEMHRKCQLIVVLPDGELFETRYSSVEGASFINHVNVGTRSRYQSDVTFINYPTQNAIKSLINRKSDCTIVLDKTVASKEPIVKSLSSSSSSLYYAVQSMTLVKAFGLENKKYFSSLKPVSKSQFTVPLIDPYSLKKVTRIGLYNEACGEFYKKMAV